MNDPEQTTFLPDRQANMQALALPVSVLADACRSAFFQTRAAQRPSVRRRQKMKIYTYAEHTPRKVGVVVNADPDQENDDHVLFADEPTEDEIVEVALARIEAGRDHRTCRHQTATARAVIAFLRGEYFSRDDRWGGEACFVSFDDAVAAASDRFDISWEDAEAFCRETNVSANWRG